MRTITINVPAKLVVSENGAAPSQPQQSSSSEIDKLLKANTPLAVWLIFLAIGGGILALYYARIGYLPEMEWKAALVYLFIGSIVGGVLGLLLTISLYLPGVMWADFIIFDAMLDGRLTYEVEHTDASGKQSIRKEPCIRSIITYLGLAYLGVLLISHLALRATKESASPSIKIIDLYWVIAAALLVVTFFVMRQIFIHLTNLKTLEGEPKKTAERQIVKYSCWFTLSVLLNQISMYLIYRLSDRTPDLTDFFVLTGMCTAGVWISTHVVAACHQHYPRQAVIASLIAAGLLLFTADSFSSLSMKLMSHYGIGYSQKFNLRVNDEGAKTVRELKLQCEESYHYLCDVQILSKMGDQYFLKVGGTTHIILPKSDVVSIRRLDPLEPGQRADD